MNKSELELYIKKATSDIDHDRMSVLLENSISLGNGYNFKKGSINIIIAMEELGELTQQLSKWIRNKGDKLLITEEVADVIIGLEYVKKVCGIDQEDINKIINIKLDRLEAREKNITQIVSTKGGI